MGSGRRGPGWTRVAFGDVVRQVKDRVVDPGQAGLERYVAGEHMDTDDLRIRHWGKIGDGYLGPAFHMRFRPGQVLYGSRRTYLRKVAVADFEGITANTTFVLDSKDPSVFLPDLLPFIMQSESFHKHSIAQSKGSVNPYVNFSDLAAYEFALPPLEEQRRRVDVLLAVGRSTEAFRTLVEALRRVESSTFDALVARSRSRNVPLGSLLVESPRNGCSAVEASHPTGHWVLTLDALTKSGYQPGRIKQVQPTAEMKAAVLKSGDLLISRSNTRELVGLAGTFDEGRRDVSWPDTMMRLRPDDSILRTRFLEIFLRSTSGRRQIQSFAAGTSASMKKINGNSLRRLVVPAPEPEVQDAITERTDRLRRAREAIRGRLSSVAQYRSTLLQSSSTCG